MVEASEQQQEILISELSELGSEGFEQNDKHLIAYFPEHLFRSYEVNEVLKGFSFTINTMEEKNWNEVWEGNFEPVIVDDFCAIRAEFHNEIKNVQHEIVITPKMSFGTGHHATTYMMIEQMRDLDFHNRTVFDFGTGTGILAILAEKLGASDVVAIDVDEWSVTNARENILRNNCSNISVQLTSGFPSEKFDLILANINRNVILGYLPQIKKSMKQGSSLLLSGLLTEDGRDIIDSAKKQNIKFSKQSERNNWISLLFINGI